jgi:hypothetical protein
VKLRILVWVVLSLVALAHRRAAAETPCLQLVLPESFPEAASWTAHIARETAQLGEIDASGVRTGCTVITLHGAEVTLTAEVKRGAVREQAELALHDVPEPQRARVGALVIGDMVRALAERPEPPATPSDQRQAFDSERPPRLQALRVEPPRPLALQGWLGARAFPLGATGLARGELSLISSPFVSWLRLSVAAYGELTRSSPKPGTVTTGGVGTRVHAGFRLFARPRIRLWLGPAVEVGALIVAADARGPGPAVRHGFAVINLDARLAAELGTRKRSRWLLALDLGAPLRPLQFAAAGETILGYAGVYAQLSVGVSLGRHEPRPR